MEKQNLIEEIIKKYIFNNRKKESPDFCPCYNGTKCHDISENKLMCIFCYCPEYQQDLECPEGKCKINSRYGKYFYHPDLPFRRIWDCSDCIIPQSRNYTEKFLENLSTKNLLKFYNSNFENSRQIFDFLMSEK